MGGSAMACVACMWSVITSVTAWVVACSRLRAQAMLVDQSSIQSDLFCTKWREVRMCSVRMNAHHLSVASYSDLDAITSQGLRAVQQHGRKYLILALGANLSSLM